MYICVHMYRDIQVKPAGTISLSTSTAFVNYLHTGVPPVFVSLSVGSQVTPVLYTCGNFLRMHIAPLKPATLSDLYK